MECDGTCVRVVAHLRSELFDAGQFYDPSLRGGCGCELDVFGLVLLFAGSFSVSQHRRNFSPELKTRRCYIFSATRGRQSSRHEGGAEFI